METILVKIFATVLALSQVTTTPDTVKTHFDRVQDQEQVAQLLHAGCTHMRNTAGRGSVLPSPASSRA